MVNTSYKVAIFGVCQFRGKKVGRSVKLKTQKIIMFIPIINFYLVFVFIRFMKTNCVETKYFLTIWLKISVLVLSIGVLSKVLMIYFPSLFMWHILDFIIVYIELFVIAYQCVKAQEKRKSGKTEDGSSCLEKLS